MNKYIILGSIITLICIIACTSDTEEPVSCDTSDLTYTNEIAAILNSSCATTNACHTSSTNVTFSLANYDDVLTQIPNNRISGSINQTSGFDPMPKGASKLPDCTIDQIDQWLADGAPE